MRSIRGRGGERAVVSYCFREEKGAEEKEEGFGSAMGVRTAFHEVRCLKYLRFPRDHFVCSFNCGSILSLVAFSPLRCQR
jgi:hypothetical protein